MEIPDEHTEIPDQVPEYKVPVNSSPTQHPNYNYIKRMNLYSALL